MSSATICDSRCKAPAERLARLEADQELMLRLSLALFTGSVWDEVARALVEYGRIVMFVWIATGVVFRNLNAGSRPTQRPTQPPTRRPKRAGAHL